MFNWNVLSILHLLAGKSVRVRGQYGKVRATLTEGGNSFLYIDTEDGSTLKVLLDEVEHSVEGTENSNER